MADYSSYTEVLELVIQAYEDATGVSSDEPESAVIDDSTVSLAVRKTVQSQIGVSLWPTNEEKVGDYAKRISKQLGIKVEDAPLDFEQ